MKPYPKYKDSGVELIGDVPEHWEVKKIKYHAFFQKGKNHKELGDSPSKNSMIYLTMDYLRESPKQIYYVESHEDFIKVDDGEILLLWDGSNAGEFVISKKGVLSSTMAVLRVRDVQKIFCWYSFKNFEIYLKESTVGMGIPHVNSNELKNGFLTVPSITEQTTIAAFLDRKTAEIDSIIAKKERLIELYEEEKAAVINHAVTKGLDPAAKMKDSGIEWLGQIPEHWETAELRRYINFITSGSRGWAEHYSDEGKIFVRIGNLTRNSIGLDLSDIQRVQPPDGAEGERTKIEKGDILFSITAYIGSVAVATDEIVGSYINQHIALVRPCLKKIYPQFVAYLACSNFGQIQLIEQGYGGTKVQLSLDDVKSLRIPIAPLKEQLAIVQHIETKCSYIDAIISKFKRQIELLKEYRTALISEAVTGKIDVREGIN